MPYLSRPGADVYFEEAGHGEAIIALHGLAENADYWRVTGVLDVLSCAYRFVGVDMRGHGRSRVTAPVAPGFDVATVAADVDALADELGIGSFHLLGHATGGMVAVRYGIEHCGRLSSLILAGTSSATEVVAPDKVERMAAGFRARTWDQLIKEFRANPGPFLFHLDRAADSEIMWRKAESMFRVGDPDIIATFIASFYDDPDPHVEALQSIACPTLVLAGEHDVLMRPSSERLARQIPNSTLVVIPGVGHMSALEDPAGFTDAISGFLRGIT